MSILAASPSAIDPRKTAHRRPGLDFLRALAIVLVVLYHAGIFGFRLPFHVDRFGWIGVDLFFVLSGYLIAGQLFGLIARGQEPDVGRFYWRRALRILPAYLAIVGIYLLLPIEWREYPRMPAAWKFFTFTQNLGLRGGTSFSHAWSLCIEAQFYFVLPFVILALARRAKESKKMSIFAMLLPFALLLWCILIRGSLAHVNPRASFGWWQQWVYYPTYSRLDALTIGVGLAALESFRPDAWTRLMKTAPWIWLPGLAAIVVALGMAENGLSVLSSSLGFFLVAAGMGTFLVCAVSRRSLLSRIAIPGAAFFATVAYSIYLSHKLAIHWTDNFITAHYFPPAPAYLLMLMSILLVSAALFFAIERPFLRIREHRR